MKPSEQLQQAARIIEAPEARAVGDFAFDVNGNLVAPCAKQAVQWCMIGALCRAARTNNAQSQRIDRAYRYLQLAIPGEPDDIADFNDDEATSHEDVLAALGRAAKLAEADGE